VAFAGKVGAYSRIAPEYSVRRSVSHLEQVAPGVGRALWCLIENKWQALRALGAGEESLKCRACWHYCEPSIRVPWFTTSLRRPKACRCTKWCGLHARCHRPTTLACRPRPYIIWFS
jgi:hypothetical protein